MEIIGIFNNALSQQTDEAVRVDARQSFFAKKVRLVV